MENSSEVYRRNSNGPKTPPCGTPDTTLTRLLQHPSTKTYCGRLDKNCDRIDKNWFYSKIIKSYYWLFMRKFAPFHVIAFYAYLNFVLFIQLIILTKLIKFYYKLFELKFGAALQYGTYNMGQKSLNIPLVDFSFRNPSKITELRYAVKLCDI